MRQKITSKQFEFARLIAEEHITSSDAYRRAYKPNPLAKKKSIHEMACRVLTNIKVQSMIRSIQIKRAEQNKMRAIRREEFVLNNLAKEAIHADNANSRIKALELLGKSISLFSGKDEINIKNDFRTPEQTCEELQSKLKKLIYDKD